MPPEATAVARLLAHAAIPTPTRARDHGDDHDHAAPRLGWTAPARAGRAFGEPTLLLGEIDLVQPPTLPTTTADTDEGQRHPSSTPFDRRLATSALLDLAEAEAPLGPTASTAEAAWRRGAWDDLCAVLTHAIRDAADPASVAADVRQWFLEMAVRSDPQLRRALFALFARIATALGTATVMAPTPGPTSTPSPPAAGAHVLAGLFSLLLEMLHKSLAVAAAAAQDHGQQPSSRPAHGVGWIPEVVTCLGIFVRSSVSYDVDRLRYLDVSALGYLLRCVLDARIGLGLEGGDDLDQTERLLTELTLVTLYAHAQRQQQRPQSPSRGPCAIAPADLERAGGLELFLGVFYSAASQRTRRLLLVLFFDLAVDHLRRNKHLDAGQSAVDAILRRLLDWGIADLLAIRPRALTYATSSSKSNAPTFLARLHASVENELQEKQVTGVWHALRATLHLDEYFVTSHALANAVKVLRAKQSPNLAEALVDKVNALLCSQRPDERLRGVRWLGELLTFGIDSASPRKADAGPQEAASNQSHDDHEPLLGDCSRHNNSGASAPAGDDLEETFCFDENAEIRLHARTRLWELLRSDAAESRVLAMQVLSVFSRRRLGWTARGGTSGEAQRAHLRELLDCLGTALCYGDDDGSPTVASLAMELILCVVVVDAPYLDRRQRVYDATAVSTGVVPIAHEFMGRLVGPSSLAAAVLVGDVAIDNELVGEIAPELLIRVLTVLDAGLHPRGPCDGGACGVVTTVQGDLMAATALLLTYCADPDPTRLLPFLDACDARVAMLMARHLTTRLRDIYGQPRYHALLRELHALALDTDDESVLVNPLVHVRAAMEQLTTAAAPAPADVP